MLKIFFLISLSIFYINCCKIAKDHKKEIFGFTFSDQNQTWHEFDFNKLTSLVFINGTNNDYDLVKYASCKGIKVFFSVNYPLEELGDKSYLESWFEDIELILKENKFHGLNLDFESSLKKDDPKQKELLSLINFLKKKLGDSYKLSFNGPWSPINKNDTATDGRDYSYLEIIEKVDYFFIFGFHVHSQMFLDSEYDDQICIAKSNSGFYETAAGLFKYISLIKNTTEEKEIFEAKKYYNNLINNKLVFVLPWFGLDYTCLFKTQFNRCFISQIYDVCSDKIAKLTPLHEIIDTKLLNQTRTVYDPHSRSTYLELKDDEKKIHQIWYDDLGDLTLKYNYVNQFGLKGLGIFTLNYLHNGDKTQIEYVKEMYRILPVY